MFEALLRMQWVRFVESFENKDLLNHTILQDFLSKIHDAVASLSKNMFDTVYNKNASIIFREFRNL